MPHAPDTIKRLQKRLTGLVDQAVAVFDQYITAENASLATLVASFNLMERVGVVEQSTKSTFIAVELLGPLISFDGLADSALQSMRQDLRGKISRLKLYVDVMQSLYDQLKDITSIAQQALIQASSINSLDLLCLCDVDSPHSACDLVSYCDAWLACVAADLCHKSDIISAMPVVGEGLEIDGGSDPIQSDEAAELLLHMHACVSAWVSRAPKASTESLSQAPLRLAPSVYLTERWKCAGVALWRFQGREFPTASDSALVGSDDARSTVDNYSG